jgi:hypothetical protein
MKKGIVTLGLGLLLTGCVADSGWKVAYEQEKTTRQEQESRIRNLEARQQTPPPQQQPPPQRKTTIPEIVAMCEKLRADRTIPVGCFTGVTDKYVPYIYFKFANHDAMKVYWDKVVELFIVDFCGRYNEAGQGTSAVIGAILADPHVIRAMNCANGHMGEWEKVEENKSVNRF